MQRITHTALIIFSAGALSGTVFGDVCFLSTSDGADDGYTFLSKRVSSQSWHGVPYVADSEREFFVASSYSSDLRSAEVTHAGFNTRLTFGRSYSLTGSQEASRVFAVTSHASQFGIIDSSDTAIHKARALNHQEDIADYSAGEVRGSTNHTTAQFSRIIGAINSAAVNENDVVVAGLRRNQPVSRVSEIIPTSFQRSLATP